MNKKGVGLYFGKAMLVNICLVTKEKQIFSNFELHNSPCSIRVELRSWSGYGALFTRLDKCRFFFHTPNCKPVSSL